MVVKNINIDVNKDAKMTLDVNFRLFKILVKLFLPSQMIYFASWNVMPTKVKKLNVLILTDSSFYPLIFFSKFETFYWPYKCEFQYTMKSRF